MKYSIGVNDNCRYVMTTVHNLITAVLANKLSEFCSIQSFDTMFDRTFIEAMIGFKKYFEALRYDPESVLPNQAMAADTYYEFTQNISRLYRLDYHNWYFNGYMQLWYKHFGLEYPYQILR